VGMGHELGCDSHALRVGGVDERVDMRLVHSLGETYRARSAGSSNYTVTESGTETPRCEANPREGGKDEACQPLCPASSRVRR
jgi:hypothetical protein